MIRKLAIPLVVLLALAMFNPREEEFHQFVEDRAGAFFAGQIGDSSLGEVLSGLGGSATRALAKTFTRRQDYLLFSVYTVDLDGSEEDRNEWRFLGILGRFYEIHRPEDARREE